MVLQVTTGCDNPRSSAQNVLQPRRLDSFTEIDTLPPFCNTHLACRSITTDPLTLEPFLNKQCTYRAVPPPFYYRRVDRRRELLVSLGVALACAIAFPLFFLLIYISFY